MAVIGKCSLYIDSLSKPRLSTSGIIGNCSDWVFFLLKFFSGPLNFVLSLQSENDYKKNLK